jgi:hypothetical protein
VNADEHEEIAASVAAHAELGPAYGAAVAEGLIERIGEEIDRRVDARLRNLGLEQPVSPQVPQQHVSRHSGPQQALPQHYGHAGPAAPGPAEPPAPSAGAMIAATVLALGSMGLGVSATAVVASHAATAAAQTVMVMLIWGTIAVINIVYARLR